MLTYDPQLKTRIRFSLMPYKMSKLVDVRTSPISDRINTMNDFVDAGYEVNVNFAQVIFYEGWMEEWIVLFEELNDKLNEKTKQQLTCEIIFLTHNDSAARSKYGLASQSRRSVMEPELQEVKYSETGGRNVCYKRGFKSELVQTMVDMVKDQLHYCNIRYAF
jgi:DNA repair photolyase